MTETARRLIWEGRVVEVRICRVWAWDDPEWREAHGIKHGPRKGGRKPVLAAIDRRLEADDA